MCPPRPAAVSGSSGHLLVLRRSPEAPPRLCHLTKITDNNRCSSSVGLMLCRRRRRRYNINPTLGQRIVFDAK